ncbi:hypothetical protein GCM10023186_05600 [Hymenobacter koreensis]|uniref:DUF1795 domain-containing protein n=2 Tax=Hymenobacter koreensis TaxID=1084523 RepID=A0ABP8IVQ2_9BACT
MRVTFFFLLLSTLNSFGQTKDHVAVSGTKVSLIPPIGFSSAAKFSGFEQASTGASILVAELPSPYQQTAAGFTKSNLASRGMTLLQQEQVKLGGTPATLFSITQQANGITYLKQILAFGDPAKTVLVTATYPEQSRQIEGPIKAALLSSVYNAKQQSKALPEANKFAVNVSGTKFKFAQSLAGSMLLYTPDGKVPSQAKDKALFMVGNSLSSVAVTDRKQYSIERLKKLPEGQTNQVRTINAVTINGLSGYEIVADGKGPNNETQLVYQTILFESNGGYYIIVGLTDNNFDTHLPLFKAIANTFKRG